MSNTWDLELRQLLVDQLDISFLRQDAREAIWGVQNAMTRPSVLYRPAISLDGNKWCALYGENLQDGVAGFGDTPEEAMQDFDAAWNRRCLLPS